MNIILQNFVIVAKGTTIEIFSRKYSAHEKGAGKHFAP